MRATLIHMELKYCERCGGLLLRRSGSGTVYCRACTEQLRDFPQRTATAKRPPTSVKPAPPTQEGGAL